MLRFASKIVKFLVNFVSWVKERLHLTLLLDCKEMNSLIYCLAVCAMRLTYSSHRSSMLWNTRLGRYVIEFEDKNLREGIIGETRFLGYLYPKRLFPVQYVQFLVCVVRPSLYLRSSDWDRRQNCHFSLNSADLSLFDLINQRPVGDDQSVLSNICLISKF